MTEEAVKEAELQRWFVDAATNMTLCAAIENHAALKERIGALSVVGHNAASTTLRGLQGAAAIYSELLEADFLAANKSIHLAQQRQMRPDLLLITDGAHPIIVELKAKPEAERQGIQELLAYGANLKMQMPHLNEPMFLIVAKDWDNLLSFGVRSLLIDGKRILPMLWRQTSPGKFVLSIMLELFELDLAQSFDPLYAMLPCTLAASRLGNIGAQRGYDYLVKLQDQIAEEARRMHQCGFVLIHTSP